MTTPAKLFAGNVHPRLFIGPDDVDRIRVSVADGFMKRVADEVLRRAAAHIDPNSDTYLDFSVGRAGWLANYGFGATAIAPIALHNFAFAFVLTRDSNWLDLASRVMDIVATGDTTGLNNNPPFGMRYSTDEPISVANLSGQLPLAFDLLHDDLDSSLRDRVNNHLRTRVVEPYRDNLLAHPRKYVAGLGQNPMWHECTTYAWTLGAICDMQRDEDVKALEQLASMVRRALHLGIDEQGVIGEGPNYGRHDMFRWVTISEIVARTGVADLFTEQPRLLACNDHWLDLLLPGDWGMLNRGDAPRTYGGEPLWHALLCAKRTNDPVRRWLFHRVGGRDRLVAEREGVRTDHGVGPEGWADPIGYALMWDDGDEAAVEPVRGGCALDKRPAAFGETVMRTGWGDDDLVLSLLAAGRTPTSYIHFQADAGHFNLYALGEAFSIDTGYGDKESMHHSVMQPRGEEPPDTPLGGFDQMWFGGKNDAFGSAAHAAFCRVNIGEMWRCYSYLRSAMLVRMPGAEPYVLLLDDTNYRADWMFYDWLVNTQPGNTIELDHEHDRASIVGCRQGHRLDIAFAMPGGSDYPSRHRVELSQDEICSSRFRGKDKTQYLGIGPRPRLKARLWGYNGLMLTAMAPRRAGDAPLPITHIDGPRHFGITIDHGNVTDTVIASTIDGTINLEGVTGEGYLTVVRRDKAGQLLHWASAQAWQLSIDGRIVLPHQGEVAALATG